MTVFLVNHKHSVFNFMYKKHSPRFSIYALGPMFASITWMQFTLKISVILKTKILFSLSELSRISTTFTPEKKHCTSVDNSDSFCVYKKAVVTRQGTLVQQREPNWISFMLVKIWISFTFDKCLLSLSQNLCAHVLSFLSVLLPCSVRLVLSLIGRSKVHLLRTSQFYLKFA